MSRLRTRISGRVVVISEHGYFMTWFREYGFEELPGIDYVDFNGLVLTERGHWLMWDSRALRERIRRFLDDLPR